MELSQIFKLALLFGAVMSVLMAVLLWFYVENFFANRVLAILTLVWGVSVFIFVIQSKEIWIRFPHLYGLSTGLNLLFFPLFFIYIKTYLNRSERIFKGLFAHFIPFVVYLLAISPFLLQSGSAKIQLLKDGLPQWFSNVINITDIVIITQGIIYSVAAVRAIHKFQFFRSRKISDIELNTVKWLNQFVIINIILWAIGTTGVFLELVLVSYKIDMFSVYYPGITILTLWMGILTIKRTQLFAFDSYRPSTLSANNELSNSTTDDSLPKVMKSGKDRITEFMSLQRPFLKSNMTMQNIVDGTGFSKIHVSEILNDELKQSFYDLVSEYRTNEVIRLMSEGKMKEYTLIHISEMAGFNSKATFYRSFKKHTGKTPNEYANLLK